MGEVGTWDPALFARFHASGEPRPFTRAQAGEHKRLLGELARINDPLVLHLVRQQRLARGRRAGAVPAVVGADRLEEADAIGAGRLALVRAAEAFDPTRGVSFAYFLAWRVLGELERAVRELQIVRGAKRASPPALVYAADDERFGALLEHAGVTDDPESLAAEALDESDRASEPRDLRRAIDVFLEDYCHFSASARAAASAVRGRFLSVASRRGEWIGRGGRSVLTRALKARGVRDTTLRVAWSPSPVAGFAGVSLQNVRT